jgi:hypothetical protein
MILMVSSPSFLTVLAHELRSPATVIGGYMRMLREGRLDEAQQTRAFAQVEEAARRISLISHQASLLRRWPPSGPTDGSGGSSRKLKDLLAASAAQVEGVSVDVAQEDEESMTFACLDFDAVVEAVRSLMEVAARDAAGADVIACARLIGGVPTIVIGSTTDARTDSSDRYALGERAPFSLERGGHGLALVLAAAVLEAHGAILSSDVTRPTLTHVTFPFEPQRQS